MNEVILRARGLVKAYGARQLRVLDGVDLVVALGASLAIVGSSGAGKSTLLHLLGGLDRPTLGRIEYRGQDITRWPEHQLARWRNERLGFVFQFHYLLPEFTALENVMLPLRMRGETRKQAEHQARAELDALGLSARQAHFPAELSGGEQQRVAVARATVTRPELLLADEPTGNLDSENRNRLRELLVAMNQEKNMAVVLVTHDMTLAQSFQNQKCLKDGRWDERGSP